MRLPVGSVVFVSHRHKRVVFRLCKFWQKIPRNQRAQGRFFAKPEGSNLQSREEHVTTFAY